MSEQWHDDHKKAIAEKWTQCPPVTTKVKELIGDEVCMGTYGLVELEVMQLENELGQARAEIERLKEYTTCTLVSTDAEMDDKDVEIAKRDKLIEQMRDALQWYKEQVSSCNRNGDAGELARDRLAKDVGKRAEAALSAAERASSGK